MLCVFTPHLSISPIAFAQTWLLIVMVLFDINISGYITDWVQIRLSLMNSPSVWAFIVRTQRNQWSNAVTSKVKTMRAFVPSPPARVLMGTTPRLFFWMLEVDGPTTTTTHARGRFIAYLRHLWCQNPFGTFLRVQFRLFFQFLKNKTYRYECNKRGNTRISQVEAPTPSSEAAWTKASKTCLVAWFWNRNNLCCFTCTCKDVGAKRAINGFMRPIYI